jgi:hypothetical protein
MKSAPQIKAALLYLLPTLAVLGVWYLLLTKGNSEQSSAIGTLTFVLTEGPMPIWFRWLLLLPVLFLGVAAGYASPLSRSRRGAQVLLGLGVLVAASAWLTVSTEVAVFASLPLVYGLLLVRQFKANGSTHGA